MPKYKLLIVDDDLEQAMRIAVELQTVPDQLLNGDRLEIHLTNSAYFAAERLSADPACWDVVLSDVFMPRPSEQAVEVCLECDNVRCWKATLEGIESIDHGGMYLAKELARARSGLAYSGLRLALISSIARRAEHRQKIRAFESLHQEWFRYWDKTNWESENTDLSLLSHRVFKFALIQAVNNRHSGLWGASAEFAVDVPAMQEIEIVARRLAAEPSVRNVFLTGPSGSGKRSVANLMNAVRHGDASFGWRGSVSMSARGE